MFFHAVIVQFRNRLQYNSCSYMHVNSQTDGEYAERHLTYKRWEKKLKNHGDDMDIKIYIPPNFSYWPEQIDWRQKNAVSTVKDQVRCIIIYRSYLTRTI